MRQFPHVPEEPSRFDEEYILEDIGIIIVEEDIAEDGNGLRVRREPWAGVQPSSFGCCSTDIMMVMELTVIELMSCSHGEQIDSGTDAQCRVCEIEWNSTKALVDLSGP